MGLVVIIIGESGYFVPGYFSYDLADAFRTLNYEPFIFDYRNPNMDILSAAVQAKQAGRDVFFFSIGAMGVEITAGTGSLYDLFNIPLFGFFIDHPIYLMDRIQSPVNQLLFSFCDSTHVDFVQRYSKIKRSTKFITHGASTRYYENADKRMSDRGIDLVFAGSYIENPDLMIAQWRNAFGTNDVQIIESTVDQCIGKSSLNIPAQFIQVAKSYQVEITKQNLEHFLPCMIAVDRYIRTRAREEVIKQIAKVKGNIHVYGNGWDKYEGERGSIQFHSGLDFKHMQRIFTDSKIVVNNVPVFVNGAHERPLNTMLAGAVCLTDRNEFLSANFVDQESIFFYDYQESDLPDRIQDGLQNSDYLEGIADQAKPIVLTHHTWLERAKEIVSFLKETNSN